MNLTFLTETLNIDKTKILSIVRTGSSRYININSNDDDLIVIVDDNNQIYNIAKDYVNNIDYIIYSKNYLYKILFDPEMKHINKQYLLIDFATGYDKLENVIVYGDKVFEYDLFANIDYVKNYFKNNFLYSHANSILKSGLNRAKRIYQAYNFMYICKNNSITLTDQQRTVLYYISRNVKLDQTIIDEFFDFYDTNDNFKNEYLEFQSRLNSNLDQEKYDEIKTEHTLDMLRLKRQPLLEAFDKYKSNIAYGIITETPAIHEVIVSWYKNILNLDPTAITVNIPDQIKYYL